VPGSAPVSYRVVARNDLGSSGFSNEATVRPLPSPPGAPADFRIEVLPSGVFRLQWTTVGDATSISIERKPIGAAFTQIMLLPGGASTVEDLPPGDGTTYVYRVRGHNAGGASDPSDEARATTLPALPAAPSELQAAVASLTEVRLTWADNSTNESSFLVERSVLGGNFQLIATLPAGSTSYLDRGLVADLDLAYRVRAHNGRGDSDPAEVLTRIQRSGKLKVTPPKLAFKTLRAGTTKRLTFTLQNLGPGALTGTVGEPRAPFRIISGGGAFSLGLRQTRQVVVEFAPLKRAAYADSLSINSTDGAAHLVNVTASGKAR
jgi:hypothetical protein